MAGRAQDVDVAAAGDRRRPGSSRPVRLIAALGAPLVAAYVILGFPGNGIPGRAGMSELRDVADQVDRAYESCGLDDRASINWITGQVSIPSTNGIVGDMPTTVGLSREELAHATGTMNFFWVICPVPTVATGP